MSKASPLRRHCFLCHKEPINNLQIYCKDCLWEYHHSRNWYSKERKEWNSNTKMEINSRAAHLIKGVGTLSTIGAVNAPQYGIKHTTGAAYAIVNWEHHGKEIGNQPAGEKKMSNCKDKCTGENWRRCRTCQMLRKYFSFSTGIHKWAYIPPNYTAQNAKDISLALR